MPVLLVATYDKDMVVDVMKLSWEGSFSLNTAEFNINPVRKTFKNIQRRRAFTLSIADLPHIKEVDYFGRVSGNQVKNKFELSGLRAERSALVDAPILVDFPLTSECTVIELSPRGGYFRVVGRILNTLVDEEMFDSSGNLDPSKFQGFYYDVYKGDYYSAGEYIGREGTFGAELVEAAKAEAAKEAEREKKS